MKINHNTLRGGKISKSQLQTLLEHIVRGVVQEIENAKLQPKRWSVKLEKEQSIAAGAGPVNGPVLTKKKDHPLEEMTTTSGGGGSSAGTPGYNIPGAWSNGNLEHNKKHIEVLGYTLTPQGKKDMKRAGDKLYENTERTKKCQNCGEPMGGDKTRCPKCKYLNDDTPDEKKLKYGAAQLQEASGLGPDFDRAQRAYDNQSAPEGDSLECPECGGTNGYYTQNKRSGRVFVWNAECPDCHNQWGDDNLDSDRNER